MRATRETRSCVSGVSRVGAGLGALPGLAPRTNLCLPWFEIPQPGSTGVSCLAACGSCDPTMGDEEMRRSRLLVAVLTVGVALGLAATSFATMTIMKKAKEAGFAAANCQYCHVASLPKKGAATLNDRGKWLMAEKEKRQATEVDVAWLKDYVEAKK
jgi:hypothetical protein